MEHMNCTAISADVPAQLPSYSAHEFFHAWNVKRIRPQSLEPVDYTKEMWTRSLWFAEGVTNTYGSYTLVRTGLWSTQQFYANLADADQANCNRAPRTAGKASSNPASMRGMKNIRSTLAPRKASPTTTRGRSWACCWIS